MELQITFKISSMNSVFKSQCNSNSQVNYAQERYNELQCSLYERIQCISIQLSHLTSYSASILKNQTLNQLVIQAQGQIQDLLNFYNQHQQNQAKNLLTKQTHIQQQVQLSDILRQYEDRVFQMGCNIYSKQVDISVDHVGKLNTQKPNLKRVIQFNKIKASTQNIGMLLQRLSGLRKNIRRLEKDLQKHKMPDYIYETGHSSCQKEKLKQKLEFIQQKDEKNKCRQSLMKTKQSSSDSSETNPQLVKYKRKGRKMLLIGSQSKIFQQKKCYVDPQISRMFSLIREQQQKEQKIKKQWMSLGQKYANLCMENRQLSNKYSQVKISKVEISQVN